MSLKGDSAQLVKTILEKSWEELEAIELDDGLMFPDVLVKKTGGKDWKQIPVLIKVPREPDLRQARKVAKAWAAEEGIDRDLDRDLFENMENIALLSICVKNTTPPYEQYEPFFKVLEKRYDRKSLNAIYAKMEAYSEAIDPRPTDMTEDQTITMIAAVAESRSVVPLVALDSLCQQTFVVSMAQRLQKILQTSKSSSEP